MNNGTSKLLTVLSLALLLSCCTVGLISDESDAAPMATYDLTANTGTYYSFDTNIPSNYSLPTSGNWSLAMELPRGMSKNFGGDIVGTPTVPGYYGMNFFINGQGSAANTINGNYVKVNLNVRGEPSPSIGTNITGPVSVSINANTDDLASYQKASSYYEVLNSRIPSYFGSSAMAGFDTMQVYNGQLIIEDYDYEGGISITPTLLNFTNVTHTESSSTFTNVTFSNGTMSFKFNPSSAGTYAVGLYISAEGPGYSGGYEEFILTNVYTYGSSPTSVSISGSSSVVAGSSITLTATTSPSAASDRTVTWSITSGSAYASLSNASDTSSGGTVRLTGTSAGTVVVKATADGGSSVYATKTITVTSPSYTCYLYYDANGGSGAPSTQSYTGTSTSSHTFNIPSSEPSRSGFAFLGWSTSSSATSASYSPGGSIGVTYNGSKTLYAVWQADLITVSGNPSANATAGTSYAYAPTVSVSGTSISVSGADWMHVSGSTVTGTPTTPGVYNVTITASKTGYVAGTQSFTITVYSSLQFTSSPATGVIAYAV